MPIQFPCPHCNHLLRVPDGSAGRQANCPNCLTVSDVPFESTLPGDAPGGVPIPTTTRPEAASGPNPFADSTPARSFAPPAFAPAVEANPYASPSAAAALADQPQRELQGLPWENSPGFSSYFQTLFAIIRTPGDAFREMRPTASVAYSLGFFAMPVAFVFLLLGGLVMVGASSRGMEGAALPLAALIGIILGLAVLIALGPLLYAVGFHLALVVVGGDVGHFGATYRATAYALGACTLANIPLTFVPVVGGLISMGLNLWIHAEAFSAVHGISIGRAWGAVILAYVGLVGLVVGALFFTGAFGI